MSDRQDAIRLARAAREDLALAAQTLRRSGPKTLTDWRSIAKHAEFARRDAERLESLAICVMSEMSPPDSVDEL